MNWLSIKAVATVSAYLLTSFISDSDAPKLIGSAEGNCTIEGDNVDSAIVFDVSPAGVVCVLLVTNFAKSAPITDLKSISLMISSPVAASTIGLESFLEK